MHVSRTASRRRCRKSTMFLQAGSGLILNGSSVNPVRDAHGLSASALRPQARPPGGTRQGARPRFTTCGGPQAGGRPYCRSRTSPYAVGSRRPTPWLHRRRSGFTDRGRYRPDLGKHQSNTPLWHALGMTKWHASHSPLPVRSPDRPTANPCCLAR
jgi:hypothetical protein